MATGSPPRRAAPARSRPRRGRARCRRRASTASTLAAIEPPMRCCGFDGETESMKRLRDSPISSGRPNARSSESRAIVVMLCSGVLPKPMPGSSTICSRAMPARAAISSERAKKSSTSAMMSSAGSTAIAIVHHDHRHAVLGGDARHVGVALQTPHVVHDRGAALERPGRDRRLDGVDRDRQAEPHDLGQDRRKTRKLVLGRNRLHAAIGPGRLRADVEDVGAFGRHAPGVIDGDGGVEELAAVGEGVRRDVENAHHGGPAECEQPRERIRLVQGGRHDAALRRRRNGVKPSFETLRAAAVVRIAAPGCALRSSDDGQYLIF